MSDLLKLSLVELCSAIHERKVSPVELMEMVISRMEEANPKLNAIVTTRDHEALQQDARISENRIMAGEAGPLEGIPLGVKDLEDAAELVNSAGSLLFKDRVSQIDSTQVQRLKKAGAIVLGKTNTPEFGHTAITKNLVYGVTRSPWNLNYSPGGSSGGSSAAIAGCVLPLVTASDGGGSVRIPASFTGAFGLKPTFGRIPNGPYDQWSYSDTTHQGPLTKTVQDAALFLDVTTGRSLDDPKSLPHPGYSYAEKLQDEFSGKLRIGFSPDFGYAVVQSDVAAVVEEGVKVFENLGHKIEMIDGGPPMVAENWNLISAFENASKLYPFFPEREGEVSRFYLNTLKNVWNMSPKKWGEAAIIRNEVNRWCKEVFSEYDLLITPTVPYDPPLARGPFPEETEGRPQIPTGVACFTIPFNQSGYPAASLRAGMSKQNLPVGMQIVGPRYGDDLVLIGAGIFERERPWHPDWPCEF